LPFAFDDAFLSTAHFDAPLLCCRELPRSRSHARDIAAAMGVKPSLTSSVA
jgi:hypothetical protein